MKYEKIEDWSEVEWSEEVKSRRQEWSEVKKWRQGKNEVKKSRSEEWMKKARMNRRNEWRIEEAKNEWRIEEAKKWMKNWRSQEVKNEEAKNEE